VLIGPARQVLALDFIEASRSQGRGQFFILLRHVMPNIAPLIIVQISIMFGAGVLIESSLSFLGVGVQPPIPSWGRTLSEAQPLLSVAPHYLLLPGAVIVVAILGFNLLGDGLRVWLDPQQSRRGTD
jgi:peptide/nickel transport system permease protein